ncbi:hypothetical protein BpHYR1_039853 [Brachionus plicatilis]|uniref:Uncharacterized protein n=1 Tax=Brachionus plicatilis TaxID=10195 RepID=A0A3M7PW44_BRAPC|nr:hypothetical protein BpHYR1_039853 [Brachionus plicatilis]
MKIIFLNLTIDPAQKFNSNYYYCLFNKHRKGDCLSVDYDKGTSLCVLNLESELKSLKHKNSNLKKFLTNIHKIKKSFNNNLKKNWCSGFNSNKDQFGGYAAVSHNDNLLSAFKLRLEFKYSFCIPNTQYIRIVLIDKFRSPSSTHTKLFITKMVTGFRFVIDLTKLEALRIRILQFESAMEHN